VAASFPGVARQVRKYCRRRILETLAKASPLFRNVTVNERMALVERFKIRTFASGERILSQGKPVDGLYLMAAGNAAVVRQKNMERRIVSQLGPGALIGEIELLLRRPVDEEVVAQHPTITLHLPREALLELGRAHPRLFVDLYERACRRDEDATTRDPPLWPNDPDLILV
jgi:signal-transduction protein with cAMP-binding, CBS, and nucleotidyltransferase domain